LTAHGNRQDEISDVLGRHNVSGTEGTGQSLEFKELMRYRIKEILLVSSLYDFYSLMEDGQLTEAIFSEFLELNLLYAPHIRRVNSGEAALGLLREEPFDLVITMLRLGDTDVASFCAAVKAEMPDMPIVLLASQSRELELFLEEADRSSIDKVYIWSGDRRIFLAIIKLIEDLRNAPADCLGSGIRSILLLEDSPAFYSSYLPLIYTELIKQGQLLIEEGRHFSDRYLRQRARPKILHAETYEEARRYYSDYRESLLGVITDITVSKDGIETAEAGLQFIREARADNPSLPVLVQSAEPGMKAGGEAEGARFVEKNSRSLLQEVGNFIECRFGFGDFVFRSPEGVELSSARTLRELRDRLRHVPENSLLFHTSRDDFSNWLMARTHFNMARRLKPVKISQFQDAAELRKYLLSEVEGQLRDDRKGAVLEFTRGSLEEDANFFRIGAGSLGGKARGLAFIDTVLKKYVPQGAFTGMNISIPRSVVLGTDLFAQFVSMNDLKRLSVENTSDEQVLRAFLRADFPPTVLGDLRALLEQAHFPLAIRSSSLLEDAMYQPFAGIYATLMLPNSNPDFSVRFHNLLQAVKYVYASTWFTGAKHYIEATGNRIEEERMAVIIQEMTGARHGRYFYPHISGVARSFNYYPFGKAKSRDGVVNLALGLGKTIVDGGVSLQFCPAYPTVHPQFTSAKDFFRNAQTMFWALDLRSDIVRKAPDEEAYLTHLNVQDAEAHGSIELLASTYSAADDRLFEGIHRTGPRVLNFAPILKTRVIPLTATIKALLGICEAAMNCPVELEFAGGLGAKAADPAGFSFLQVRPMVKMDRGAKVYLGALPREALLLRRGQGLGNGVQTLQDVVYIRPEEFDPMRTREMVGRLSELNSSLTRQHRPYLLIGPGRWGSSDPSLGIPVKFPDISGARAIVETSLPNLMSDPSQGSHFFQNLTSFRIMYFTLRHFTTGHEIDWDWLGAIPAEQETRYIRHVRTDTPLRVVVDGVTGEGAVIKGS